MSSLDLLPLNVTISSQTASIQYLPYREGLTDGGWNTSYSNGAVDTGYGRAQGVGADYHRTSHAGATMEFEWTGTAIYLYGNATAGSYSINVDNENINASNDVPQGGLLGSKTGLKYGSHKVKLSALGTGEVAFQYAQATIGVGKPGNIIQNRTIMAVDEQTKPQPNPFFQYGPSWGPEPTIMQMLYPNGTKVTNPRQMLTNAVGSTVTFTLDQASAFFLWGAVNYDHQTKEARIWLADDADGRSKATVKALGDNSNYLDFQQVRGNASAAFSFNRLEIMDGGSNNDTSSSSGGGVVGNGTAGGSNTSNSATRLGVKDPSLPLSFFSEMVLLLVTISALKRLLRGL